jgi:FecR protein
MRGMRNRSRRGTRAMSLLVVGALAAGALALTASAAGAAETLAKLKVTADSVQIKQKGKSTFVDAKDGMALKQGDTIKTDASGLAEIDYTDGSLTRLANSTVFTISVLTNEKGGRQTQGTLSVGETWNRAAKVSETGSFEVKAGGTTAAVEGTAFVAKCVPKSDGSQAVDCTFTAVVDDIKVDSDLWDVTSVTDTP